MTSQVNGGRRMADSEKRCARPFVTLVTDQTRPMDFARAVHRPPSAVHWPEAHDAA